MLPEILSNGLCSLNPLVDRLSMVCEMTISAAGKLTGYQFYEAVIHSHARLTYTRVSQLLEMPESIEAKQFREQLPHLVPHIEELYALYKALVITRQERGAIDFETQETRIVFGADKKISEIRPTQRNDAHKLIEECMLCANVATAKFLEKHSIPALYRVHDAPPLEKQTKLRQFLGEIGLTLTKGKTTPTPKDYQALLKAVHDRPDFRLIQTVMLRSLSQAVYSPDNEGHFGLNYEAYTHFTSPIRRYPDLLVHRAIRSVIRSKVETRHVKRAGAAAMPKARIYPYDEAQLDQLGEQCSMTERRADEATRDVANWLKCEYMRDRVGETYPGVITAVTGFGLFVELSDIYVEGLVHVTALPSDYYHFDAVHHRLSGERSGRSYRLGDVVEIVVARVDLDERKIDFELSGTVHTAPTGRRTRGDANTAKEKSRKREKTQVPAQNSAVGIEVSPELLKQAEVLLGNTDVKRSRAVKRALLDEAKTGGEKPVRTQPAGQEKVTPRTPAKKDKKKASGAKSGKPAKSTKATKPSKHRKGPSKPKAQAASGEVRKRKVKS
jgi:ribonuclease R